MNQKHFLKLLDFTPAEIQHFLDVSADLKAKKKAGIPHKLLQDKQLALISVGAVTAANILLLLLQVSYYLFETYGILYTNATISGLVLAVVPVVAIGTGALFLREYPTRRQALFCILPVAGVIIMTISGKELGVVTPMGILFLALTLLSSALFKTVNRKAAQEFTSFERTFLVLSVSAIFFSVTALREVGWNAASFVAPLANIRYLLPVLCMSLLNSIGANMLVNYATGKMSVFKVASFGSLSTLCSTVAGVLFLQEPVSIALLLGAVLILVGIRQVNKAK